MFERISRTIETIYAAGSGSARWEDALLAIEQATGCTGAVIDLVPKSPAIGAKTLAGSFSEENCAEYALNYQAICPRIRHAVANPSESIQYDYLFMTEAEMDHDPVYEWFGKHGLRYYYGAPIAETPSYFGFLSLQRTRRQGHVQPEDLALFDLLRPHVERAISLADQLDLLRSHRKFSSAMLEAFPHAVFAVDANGRVLFANAAGRHLISEDGGLGMEAGRLRAGNAAEHVQLEAMIKGASAPIGGKAQGWTRVSRPSGGLPLALFVSPLVSDDESLTSAGAKVLVVVHDTAMHRCASIDMLVRVYGLTETEARLASALSGGHSLESAAALLHMQVGTARSHLKSIFRKTGSGRQQDLVRMLASVSLFIGSPD